MGKIAKISITGILLLLIILPSVNAAVPPEIYLYEDEQVVWKQTVLEVESEETTITYKKINIDSISEGADTTDISYTITKATQTDYESNGIDGSNWIKEFDKDIKMKSVELNTSFQGYFNEYDSSGVEIYTLSDDLQFQTINRIYGDLYTPYAWMMIGVSVVGYGWADTSTPTKEAVCTGSGNRLINCDLKYHMATYNNTEGKWKNATLTNKCDIYYCKEANVLFGMDSEIVITAVAWNSTTSKYDTEIATQEVDMEILYPSELVNDAPSLEDIPGMQFFMILAMLSIGAMFIAKKKEIL